MTEIEIWNILKKRALETDLDWAIFYYKKAVYFNSDYLRKKQRRPTKEELIASVEELEGALRGKIKSEYKKD